MLIEYHSNNSGGYWWLKDKDWLALEKAGWRIIWANESFIYDPKGNRTLDEKGLPKTENKKVFFCYEDNKGIMRFMGALAKYAFKHFDSVKEALIEFEKVTGQDVMDEGCNCCGAPHFFSWDGGCCSGDDCGEYLYGSKAKLSKRELLENK